MLNFKREHYRVLQYCFLFFLSFFSLARAAILDDKGLISSTSVYEIIPIHHTSDIINALQKARQLHKPVSILAKQHSQGGQTIIRNGIALDMLPYNHVLKINKEKMQVTVESGITWDKLQQEVNPYHLAIGVMQSSNIFSVGGSMSVNAHGLDFRLSPIINTIVSFHLILANGKTVEVSPNKNPDLWNAVIGGYGLLGVISDVTLQLVPDTILKSNIQLISIKDLNKIFFNSVLPNKENVLLLGRLSTAPNENLLRTMLLITFSNTHVIPEKQQKLLNPENMNFIVIPLFNWSRHSNFGKKNIWQLEKLAFKQKYTNTLITRNNSMRFAIDFAVSHHEKNHADWLQEYYLPPEKLSEFVEYLRNIVIKNQINLLNGTIRYVQGDAKTKLSYGKKPTFSIVLYFDQELIDAKTDQSKQWTQKLIKKAEELGGNYYLPYQPFATQDQFKKGYPKYKEFLKVKQEYDPNSLFSNNFYVTYLTE